MHKGLYFMGWYRDMWNYHPSLPLKNMQMVEDITDIHANMLIWSCLGSGAIGLPYLDKEANDDTAPRLRLYGFMNDKEFCAECKKRGVRCLPCCGKRSYGNSAQNLMRMRVSCYL